MEPFEYTEYFKVEEFTDVLLNGFDNLDDLGGYDYDDAEYEYNDRLKTCEVLYNAFNDAMRFLPDILGDLDEDNAMATQYSFDRDHNILISEESLLFFHNLIHHLFFNEEIKDADGYPMVVLEDFIKDRETYIKIISVCAVAYSWNYEYQSLKEEDIISKEKNQRRARRLQKNYKNGGNKEALLRGYKKADPENMKRMQRILFEPALNSLLHDNPYKNEIIQELKVRILPRKY